MLRRNALVAEATTEGIYEWNIEGEEIHPSPRFMKLLGYESTEPDPADWNWISKVHPDDLERYRISVAASLKDDSVRYECTSGDVNVGSVVAYGTDGAGLTLRGQG